MTLDGAPVEGRSKAWAGRQQQALAGGVGVPWAGIGLSEHERTHRLGYTFHASDLSDSSVLIELVTRRESTAAQPEHALSVQSTLRW